MRHKQEQRLDEGVSPVIAIILMVAITVVLAGVLYVWVIGMADTDSSDMNLATFDAELHSSTRNLTVRMNSGDPIFWDEHALKLDGIELDTRNVSDDGQFNAGDTITVYIDFSYGITLIVGNKYRVEIVNYLEGNIVYDDETTCAN